jgi:signal transduction histidine kinase
VLVIKGADEGKQFELTETTVGIGRDPSNKIRLHDTEVSRRHAEFRQADGTYLLVDTGSANGTFVNTKRIQEAHLEAGDQIHIGQSTLVFSLGRSDAAAETSDLAQRISMITRGDVEMSSAIIKTIGETEGSRILAQADKAASPWLKNALANLTIMYEASQATSHILDQQELLDRILELIFRTITADRGCVMLSNAASGDLEPKAVRWRREGDREEKFALSRTIVDYVLQEKQGVLVADAAKDQRFRAGQSIVKFGIREVICVPMKGRHETLGVLYLDTHSGARDLVTRPSATAKFTEDHLALAIAVAHQAALAVEETRYHHAMVQAERLAAIGQTIAALSHHIKNILQGLRSGSDIIKMGLKDKNENLIQQGWRVAEKNQGKIYNLVMDMLSYSKDRVPAVEMSNPNDIVRDVFELMENRAKELGVTLELKLDEDLPSIPIDPEGIHRALLNVVGNALDAVEDRPQAQVTLGTRLADAGWLRIIVLDNGVGIPPQKQGEIFKPFVSTKGARGTGLGLAVSRKILREHGGDILVQSQVGVGSKFIFMLPVKSPLQDPSTTAGETALLPPGLDED